MNRTKQGLLAAAARKPVHKFLQMDGFMNVEGDCVMHPDADGDTVFFGETDELRNLRDIVRFSIPWDADADAVRRIVRKMADLVEAALRFRDEQRAGFLPPAVREELLAALQRVGDVTKVEITGIQDQDERGATTVSAVLHGRTETATVRVPVMLLRLPAGLGFTAYLLGERTLDARGDTAGEALRGCLRAVLDKLCSVEVSADRLELWSEQW